MLVEFFWRYSLIDDGECGWDTNVQLADGGQADLFEEKVRGWIDTVKGRKNLLNYEKTFECCPMATYKVVMPIGNDDHALLIRRPFFCDSFPFGRSTRGFVAYDIDGDEVVFMKDAWRTSGYGARKSEKEIYDLLKARGVPYIHKVLFAGDVTGIKAAHRQLIGHTMPPTAAARSGTPIIG